MAITTTEDTGCTEGTTTAADIDIITPNIKEIQLTTDISTEEQIKESIITTLIRGEEITIYIIDKTEVRKVGNLRCRYMGLVFVGSRTTTFF